MQDFIKDADSKMKKAVEVFKRTMAGVRTGRASAGLVENIVAEYYGTQVPIKQIANISVPEPRQIAIQPYDKTAVTSIEKALMKSELGVTPKTEGGVLRLMMPQLTEERRKDLIKIIKKEAEDAKVSIRNIRREIIDNLKAAKDKKEITEDIEKTKEGELQKLTDREIVEIDKATAVKEKEIMEV